MKKTTYVAMSIIFASILTVVSFLYNNTEHENLVLVIGMIIVAILFLHLAYLLIIKKSYNLLAGISEKRAKKIKNTPEEEKMIKTAKNMGYMCIFIALFILAIIPFLIK